MEDFMSWKKTMYIHYVDTFSVKNVFSAIDNSFPSHISQLVQVTGMAEAEMDKLVHAVIHSFSSWRN